MTTEVICREHAVKLEELCTKAMVQEAQLSGMAINLAKAETRIQELESKQACCTTKVIALQAWKNKALGYIGALGILTMYIIESFRDHFWGR